MAPALFPEPNGWSDRRLSLGDFARAVLNLSPWICAVVGCDRRSFPEWGMVFPENGKDFRRRHLSHRRCRRIPSFQSKISGKNTASGMNKPLDTPRCATFLRRIFELHFECCSGETAKLRRMRTPPPQVLGKRQA